MAKIERKERLLTCAFNISVFTISINEILNTLFEKMLCHNSYGCDKFKVKSYYYKHRHKKNPQFTQSLNVCEL